LEHLDAIVGAVADIDKAVAADLGAVHGIAELLGDRRGGIVLARLGVVGLAAVGPPVALVGERVGVEHDDAAIAVAVGDVDLVGRLVDLDIGGLAEQGRVVAAAGRRDLADLAHELAGARELQHRAVGIGVAAHPDEALAVGEDAVLAADPGVAVARAAP